MKKIISIVLCLALVFSICSFSLSANAEEELMTSIYCFNNNSLRLEFIMGKFYGEKRRTCHINFIEEPEGTYINPSIVTEYGEGDLEYIIKDFLLNKITSYQISITTAVYFTTLSGVTNKIDENDISYIVSTINPQNLEDFSISDNVSVKSMTPIVDALYETCSSTLKSFLVTGKSGITQIDDRIFTDFSKMKTINLSGCDVYNYEDPVKISIGPSNERLFYIYVPWEEACNVLYGKVYDCDESAYMSDYYNNNILPHFVGSDNITVKTTANYSSFHVYHYYNCNGIKARLGSTISGKLVIEADPSGDGYVDSFDVAMATECVNTFEDPEDAAVMAAMDVVADGYIDATDLAYINYIANFEG